MGTETEPVSYDGRPELRLTLDRSLTRTLSRCSRASQYLLRQTGFGKRPQPQILTPSRVPPDNEPPPYTLPAIQLPDGTYVMDSYQIADVIEAKYPSPPLRIDRDLVGRLRETMGPGVARLRPCFTAQGPKRWLSEASIEYWTRTRTARLGMPLDELEAQRGGRRAWEEAAPAFRAVTAMYREGANEGPFLAGKEVQFADFVWIAYLLFWRTIGEDDLFQELLKSTGDPELHLRLLTAAEPWSSRNDH
jgi:glutathione S-transferase